MERIKKGIALITGFCLFWTLILFITSATVCNIAGDRSLMAVEMRRHASPKVTGLPDKEYSEMGLMITDYLMGRRESFQYYYTDAEGNLTVAFHPHEEEHMADCRELIRKTGILRWIAGGASVYSFPQAALYQRRLAAGCPDGSADPPDADVVLCEHGSPGGSGGCGHGACGAQCGGHDPDDRKERS